MRMSIGSASNHSTLTWMQLSRAKIRRLVFEDCSSLGRACLKHVIAGIRVLAHLPVGRPAQSCTRRHRPRDACTQSARHGKLAQATERTRALTSSAVLG